MTREEAIEVIQKFMGWFKPDSRIYKALKIAIKALSQEPCRVKNELNVELNELKPCTDAVSRDFQIGDEVRIIGSDPIYDDCDVGWVIRNASEKVKTMYVMRNDGSADEEAKAEWYKTGRHNAVLAEVIKALPSVTQKSDNKYRKEAKRWKNKWLKSQRSQKSGKCELKALIDKHRMYRLAYDELSEFERDVLELAESEEQTE